MAAPLETASPQCNRPRKFSSPSSIEHRLIESQLYCGGSLAKQHLLHNNCKADQNFAVDEYEKRD